MNRHDVARIIAEQRTTGARTVDGLARALAELLPPSQRDQFLLAAGVPRESAHQQWLRQMAAEHGHCSQ